MDNAREGGGGGGDSSGAVSDGFGNVAGVDTTGLLTGLLSVPGFCADACVFANLRL